MKYLKYLFVFFIAFASCKSSKTITKDVVVKEMSARRVAKKHLANDFDQKTVDAKLKVQYKDANEEIGFSVKMKIKKDEVIWLKGSKVITVFKAKITPTTVSFYSPVKKNYFEGDFSMLEKLLGAEINFQQLQNLLFGQAVLDVKENKQSVTINETAYMLTPEIQQELFDIFFWVNPKHFKLNKQSLVNELQGQRLDISYPNYHKKNNVYFPEEINISAKAKNKFTNINMTVRSVDFNTDLDMPFSIPRGYKEIKL